MSDHLDPDDRDPNGTFEYLEVELHNYNEDTHARLIKTPAELFDQTSLELQMKQKPYMGIVEIKGVIDDPGSPDHGKVVSHVHSNVITLSARAVMALALAGQDKIVAVHWGSGSTPPQRSDPQPGWPGLLENFQIASAIDAATPTTDDSILFSSTLPPTVGTGLQLSEVGLVSLLLKLFARFTFPPQDKFDRLRLSVNWQIIII
jgi:hypothetical protein